MLGRILLTIDAFGLTVGTLKADYFSETHMFNPRWRPHAKFHNAQTVSLSLILAAMTLYYTWRRAPSPQLRREFLFVAALAGSIYWFAGLLAILPPGTMGVDPEFGGPAFPQGWLFGGFMACALVGAWLEY
ncbi:Uu.00g132090.m01.CDS01 [Anthostomella pinea]|uniref:Uu.00g132090.m01.CDS01 n=1 Tax=Anthostomella pinea TaxID=933095 RepID=A0AAI8VJY7_9PEZI|nr:Uu.00g132090.m01.CDS01 [Anthostomella pinea]